MPSEQVKGQEEAVGRPTLLYIIKQIELATRSRLDELLKPGGLTALQYTALTVMERQPDLTSAQLARNSFVTAQSMADMIVILEGRGLIRRRRDETDRRRLVLSLTAAGRRILKRYGSRVAALEAEMLADLTPAQAAELRQSLLSCRAAIAGRRPKPGARRRF